MNGIVIAAIAIFLAGVAAGIIGIATLASRREDRQLLRNRPHGIVAKSGRFITGLKVDLPDPDAEHWEKLDYWTGPHRRWDGRPARRPRSRRRARVE